MYSYTAHISSVEYIIVSTTAKGVKGLFESHETILGTIDREAPETRLLRHINIYHISRSTRPITYHLLDLTSFLPRHHSSNAMSSTFDPYTSGCSPGNSSCNYNVGSINPFEGDVEYDFYGYNIQLYTAAIFVAFYGLATRESSMVVIFHQTSLTKTSPLCYHTVAHLVLGALSRQPWTLMTFFLGTLGELIGWSARLIASRSTKWDPSEGGSWESSQTAFMAQIAVLIFSPAFLQAGCYIALGRIIPVLGYVLVRSTTGVP